MKIRIKSGDCPSYLTVGRVYEVTIQTIGGNDYLWVESWDGSVVDIDINNCVHLNGGSWEIVDE